MNSTNRRGRRDWGDGVNRTTSTLGMGGSGWTGWVHLLRRRGPLPWQLDHRLIGLDRSQTTLFIGQPQLNLPAPSGAMTAADGQLHLPGPQMAVTPTDPRPPQGPGLQRQLRAVRPTGGGPTHQHQHRAPFPAPGLDPPGQTGRNRPRRRAHQHHIQGLHQRYHSGRPLRAGNGTHQHQPGHGQTQLPRCGQPQRRQIHRRHPGTCCTGCGHQTQRQRGDHRTVGAGPGPSRPIGAADSNRRTPTKTLVRKQISQERGHFQDPLTGQADRTDPLSQAGPILTAERPLQRRVRHHRPSRLTNHMFIIANKCTRRGWKADLRCRGRPRLQAGSKGTAPR